MKFEVFTSVLKRMLPVGTLWLLLLEYDIPLISSNVVFSKKKLLLLFILLAILRMLLKLLVYAVCILG